MLALARFLYENRGGILQAQIYYFHELLLNYIKHMRELFQPSITISMLNTNAFSRGCLSCCSISEDSWRL